ncbi:MAG: hypothetical protein Q8L78_05030 [Coxiellaceae bacterium]|nr:hypothetical protein [Coxiellaceae bacterium]
MPEDDIRIGNTISERDQQAQEQMEATKKAFTTEMGKTIAKASVAIENNGLVALAGALDSKHTVSEMIDEEVPTWDPGYYPGKMQRHESAADRPYIDSDAAKALLDKAIEKNNADALAVLLSAFSQSVYTGYEKFHIADIDKHAEEKLTAGFSPTLAKPLVQHLVNRKIQEIAGDDIATKASRIEDAVKVFHQHRRKLKESDQQAIEAIINPHQTKDVIQFYTEKFIALPDSNARERFKTTLNEKLVALEPDAVTKNIPEETCALYRQITVLQARASKTLPKETQLSNGLTAQKVSLVSNPENTSQLQATVTEAEQAIKNAELTKVAAALKKYGQTTSGLMGIFQSKESGTLQSTLKQILKSADSTDIKHEKMRTAITEAFDSDKYKTKKSAFKDELNKAITIEELKKAFPGRENEVTQAHAVPSLR